MSDPSASSGNATWQIQLFGGLFARYGGRPPLQIPHRCQTLLAALCLRPALRTRDQLACLLYPDDPETTAKARLSDRLWLLRNALPGFPFHVTPVEIAISTGQVIVDVDIFRGQIRQSVPTALEDAVRLYTGELLPTLDEEWLLVERENLHLLYVRALQQLSSHYLRVAEYERALPLFERLIQTEPFDESHLRGLLRAYQAVGQRGAALAVFERFRLQLRAEMDLEPEPATLDVVEAIRTQALPIRHGARDEHLTEGAPADILRRVRAALWRGEFDTVRAWLASRRKNPAGILPEDLDAVAAECAILCGEHLTAHSILDPYGERASFSLQVQALLLLAEERKYSAVLETGKTILLDAHLQKDVLAETLVLQSMGVAFQRTGNASEAMRCAAQCISLAEKAGLSYPLALGYHLKGSLLGSQGFDRDALEILHHAASHALENGFRLAQVKIEGHLGVFYQNAGKYRASLDHYARALEIARDLSLPRAEAENLQNCCIVYSSLGRRKESIQSIRAARKILLELEDELGLARNSYHLAFSLSYEEDADFDEILAIAKQALAVFEKKQSLGWIASVHGLMGYVYWLKKEPQAAISACQTAIPIYQELEEFDYIPELYGYIGLALLDLGQPEKALDYTSKALEEMMHGELYDLASEIYYAQASVLAALGRESEALEYLRRGYENLLTYAEEIEDPEARQAYFRRDPTVCRLMDMAYARGVASPPQVEMHTLSSRGRTPVRVAVMVDAGASDLALKNASGSVALRRERIARILREARAQGAEPSPAQIAAMMNVSLRTVQRDIAGLGE